MAAIVLGAAGIVGLMLARAQEITDTNIDWSQASDLQIELAAVEQTTPIPLSELPDTGTFWSAQHSPVSAEPWPPLPIGFLNAPAWPIGGNNFISDDLDVDYEAMAQVAARSRMASGMRAMDEDGDLVTEGLAIDTNGLWLEINAVSNGLAYLTLHGTTNAYEYEILSQPALGDGTNVPDWNPTEPFWGSSATNWTAVTVPQNGSTNLFFSARSMQDTDGNGLPVWWQLKYFGTTGIDPYADPDGDGWNNLQEYQNGTDPTVFNTPPAPQGVRVVYDDADGVATVTWVSAPGPVTGYVVDFDGTDYTVSASANSFTLSVGNTPNDPINEGPTVYGGFKIAASYAGGNSSWSDDVGLESGDTFLMTAYLIPGPQNSVYLAVTPSTLSPGTVSLRISREDYYSGAFTTNDIPLSDFTNGLYLLPSDWESPALDSDYEWFVQTIDANGSPSAAVFLTYGYYSGSALWLVPPLL